MFAYNQERFIGEAVAAALAQTWSPLEIILSDDCSSDGTFRIMQLLVDAYRGPHRVRLLRAEVNQGIGAHVNKVVGEASGELIVVAAGDDISLPQRTETLVKRWLAGERRAHSIYSAATVINDAGEVTGVMDGQPRSMAPGAAIRSYMDGLQGCSHAWSREVFSVFGPVLPDTVCEDRVIALRSTLLGGIDYCPEALVKYRIHVHNVSHHQSILPDQVMARTRSLHARNLNIAENYLRDLALAVSCPLAVTADWLQAASQAARELRDVLADKVAFHDGGFWRKGRLVAKYLRVDPAQSVRFAVQWLLPWWYRRVQTKNLGAS
ncbi:MAG TPA: glycosyltransferase [Rhodanobacteraceae bacterium]|nr:glycosyltransferase [Rhodanobacteraceae bacterium]